MKENFGEKQISIETILNTAREQYKQGHLEEAFQFFEKARAQARNERNDDLYMKITLEIEKLLEKEV